jgi:hypothetical protein
MSCVIVLGCYRTGTSAIAGILHHLGVVMGAKFDKPAHSNPEGFFEDVEFKGLFSKLASGRDVEGSINVLCRLREAQFGTWGVKDPQLCLLLPKLLPLIETEHRLIYTVRPPLEICESLSRAMPESVRPEPEKFLPLVSYYLSRRETNLNCYGGEKLEVEFAKLKSDPKSQVERIATFVGKEVNQAALDHFKA